LGCSVRDIATESKSCRELAMDAKAPVVKPKAGLLGEGAASQAGSLLINLAYTQKAGR
jgi:hypothetical protein